MVEERLKHLSQLAALSVLAVACRAAPTPSPAPMSPGLGQLDTLASIRWSRSSAEHDALFREVYGAAATELQRMVSANPPGRPWGVIMDADETILDNAQYQQERAVIAKSFDAASWDEWVKREAATALPGTIDFAQRVHGLGGRVVVVTNRLDSQCDATRENLRRIHFDADRVLCAPPGISDKNPRFDAVQSGPEALTIEMWLGDNINDFPKLNQSVRARGDSGYVSFGHRFFVLPNPMYGSWSSASLP